MRKWAAAAIMMGVLGLACSATDDGAVTGDTSEALGNGYDHKFWLDSHFPGSTAYKWADGSTWYDSDLPWSTGSIVRLPTDSKYIGDVYSTVYCTDGTTKKMRSPEFSATVGGVTRKFLFNHLETFYLGSVPTGTWFNGGTVIGLTGGGTCITGYPTHSSGPHFCNEVDGEDPYTFWEKHGSSYTSSCTHNQGTSGAANPACPCGDNVQCGTVCCPSGDFCGPMGKCCDPNVCSMGCPC